MNSMLFDTDVLVDYFRGLSEADKLVRNSIDHMVLSAVVVAELFAGVRSSEEAESLDRFIQMFPSVDVTVEIARAAGRYRNHYGRSHGVGIADALIAASAESIDAELVTRNVRHFPMFPALTPPY